MKADRRKLAAVRHLVSSNFAWLLNFGFELQRLRSLSTTQVTMLRSGAQGIEGTYSDPFQDGYLWIPRLASLSL